MASFDAGFPLRDVRHTLDEALANLAEAVELYLEEVDDPTRHVTATPPVTSFHLPAA